MWIGIFVTGSFYDQFEVVYLLEQKIQDDVFTLFEVLCGIEVM
jgi:hypothetical protein